MKRNNVYDIAKCWAIFSVIVYHVINIIYNNQPIHSFVDTYFLTFFFFISGLLTKKEKVSQDGWLKKQTIHLLVPFVTVFILYRVYQHFVSGFPIISLKAFDDSKSGFWFLLTLYCFFVTLKLHLFILQKIKSNLTQIAILIMPFLIVAALCLVLSNEMSGYLSLMSYRRYWLFFAYGYIISNYYDYDKLVANKAFQYLSVPAYLVFATLYIVKVQDISTNLDFVIRILANFTGCHFWIIIFEKFKDKLSKDIILNVGKNTLGIYLLHYFPLSGAKLLLGSDYHLNENLLNYIYATITVFAILFVSYFVTWAIKQNKIMAFLILGIENRTQNN